MKQSRKSSANVIMVKVLPVSSVVRIINSMCGDVLRLPDSPIKDALVDKMINLLDSMDDNKSPKAKHSERLFDEINHSITSLDDRTLTNHSYRNFIIPSGRTGERQYPREAYDPTTRKGFGKRLCSMQRQLISVASALNEVIEQVGDGTLFRNNHPRTDCTESRS